MTVFAVTLPLPELDDPPPPELLDELDELDELELLDELDDEEELLEEEPDPSS